MLAQGPMVVTLGKVTRLYRRQGVPHVEVETYTDGRKVQARAFTLGGAVRVAVALGDEALVLTPDGREARRVALLSPENGTNKQTQDVTGVEITHPDGCTVRKQRTDTTKNIVVEDALDDLATHLTALETALTSIAPPQAPVTGATLAAALASLNLTPWSINRTTLAPGGAATNPHLAKSLKVN